MDADRRHAAGHVIPPERELKPIETRYKGYRFRSRLEARWAVYFDQVGIRWDYELQGYDLGSGVLYLPDFWLPQVRMWAEVKPNRFTDDEIEKAFRLAACTGHQVLFLVGVPSPLAYMRTGGFVGDGLQDYQHSRERGFMDCLLYDWKGKSISSEGRFFESSGEADWSSHEPQKISIELDDDRMFLAIMAARSARFEHGQTDGGL